MREREDLVVEHRDGRVDVQLHVRRQARLREAVRDDRDRDEQRPARPAAVGARGRERDEHDRDDVEEVPLADDAAAEAEVERGHLEREHDDRRRAERRERVPFARVGAREVAGEPADADEEREDPHPERDHRDVLGERRHEVVREDVPLDRLGVRAERAFSLPAAASATPATTQHCEDDREHAVSRERAPGRRADAVEPARPALGEGQLVRHDRDREHEGEHGELRTGERRERDPGESEHVVARAARATVACWRPRSAQRNAGYAATSVSRNDANTIHGTHTERSATRYDAILPPGHAPREQERRDRRGGHHERVEHVGVVERRSARTRAGTRARSAADRAGSRSGSSSPRTWGSGESRCATLIASRSYSSSSVITNQSTTRPVIAASPIASASQIATRGSSSRTIAAQASRRARRPRSVDRGPSPRCRG